MKHPSLPYFLLLLLAFIAACRPPAADPSGFALKTGPRPLKFTALENNPVLSSGEPGAWDALSSNTPDIVYSDSVFYLFYTGSKVSGNMAVGLSVSYDGYHFNKYAGNPVFVPDNQGFDAYSVGATRTVKVDSLWWMYYNAMEIAGFSPGPFIGRAVASHPTGPWIRSNMPVLTSGHKGEWDDGFIIPSSVLVLENGSFIMYYSAGKEYHTFKDFYLGMAVSQDGISWKKYNDPATTEHPFKESDPVMITGTGNEWDNGLIWLADIKQNKKGFTMFYTGIKVNNLNFISGIGFATSKNGITWEKYQGNPVYTAKDDPYAKTLEDPECVENPSLLFLDSLCFMYYDYSGPAEKIGVAVSKL